MDFGFGSDKKIIQAIKNSSLDYLISFHLGYLSPLCIWFIFFVLTDHKQRSSCFIYCIPFLCKLSYIFKLYAFFEKDKVLNQSFSKYVTGVYNLYSVNSSNMSAKNAHHALFVQWLGPRIVVAETVVRFYDRAHN